MFRSALSHALHLITEAAIGLLGLLTLASCVLAWRLAQGPIDVTELARRLEASLAGPGVNIGVGSAALAWEGFRQPDRALDIRVTDATITNSARVRLVQVPRASVTLALWPLILGHVVPRTLELDGSTVELRRNNQGNLDLDLSAASQADKATETNAGNEVLRELAKRPAPGDALPWLSQISSVSIRNTQVTVKDSRLGVIWQAPRASVDLKRLRNGGISGSARLDLAVGDVRGTLQADAQLNENGTHVSASLSPVSPAALARISPIFSAGAAFDALITASLEADLDPFLTPRSVKILVSSGEGHFDAGQGAVSLKAAAATIYATPKGLQVSDAQLVLAAPSGAHAPAPIIQGGASAVRSGGRITMDFSVAINAVDFRDLPSYWPPGTGGGARSWLTQNLTGGETRSAHVAGSIDSSEDFSEMLLKSLTGDLIAEDVAVSWLKPIPPIQHGRAHVHVDGPDALTIDISGGDQGRIKITDGTVRISGLSEAHQVGTIDVNLAGDLSDTLALLNHPRLKLLSRRNMDLANPAGHVRGKLSVKLPLEANVDMDDIGIDASASLDGVHLENVVAGKTLDDGTLSLQVNGNGLKLGGTGSFAAIPSKFDLNMDFRNGLPSQILEHLTASGDANSDQLRAAGAPESVASAITSGHVTINADYTGRRDGAGSVKMSADLDQAALTTPLGWSKTQDEPAMLSAEIELRHGKLIGVNKIVGQGPHLTISGQASLSRGSDRMLTIDKGDVGATSAKGWVKFPEDVSQAIDVQLSGRSIDLSPLVGSSRPNDTKLEPSKVTVQPPTQRGRPWHTELAFDQVILGKTKRLNSLRANITNDGRRFSQAHISTSGEGAFKASIIPGPSGRAIAIDSDDAGTTLAALGIADNLRGGHLSVEGSYDDTQTLSPLSGTATLSEFSVTDAPAIGRLLQALTFYGLADLLRGPGLHFSRMVAPFYWENHVLQLQNARAFSSSLGLTAQGSIDLGTRRANVIGTVVPAYFFNQLPGKIPLFGRLFAPEKGGGVFAARYSVRGPLSDPKVGVNPLSALTPGFLRGIFGLFSSAPAPAKP